MKKSFLLSGSLLLSALLSIAPAKAQSGGDNTEPLPYYQTFDDESSLNDFIIIDHNNDTWTWRFGHGHVGNLNSEYNGADDYLLTPLFHLEKGKHYLFRYLTWSYSSGWTERLETLYGTGDDPTTYNKVEQPFNITGGPQNTLTRSNVVTPDADGDYRFAFHAISSGAYYWLFIDNLLIEEVEDGTPVAAVPPTVVPGEKGSLSAKITFTAPDKDIIGNELNSIDSVNIVRNDTVVGNATAQPGQQASYVDNSVPKSGYYSYKVIAWSKGLKGMESDVTTAFIGEDTPVAPKLNIKDNSDGSGLMSWTPDAKGRNNLYVNNATMKYNVVKLSNPLSSWELLDSAITDTTYEVDIPNTGEQNAIAYGVQAVNKAGQSTVASKRVITGAPYSLPFHETFANGHLDNPFWLNDGNGQMFWQITSLQDCDGLGGAAAFQSSHDHDWATFESGKIGGIKDAKDLRLIYYYNFNINHHNGNTLRVIVYTPDGGSDTLKVYHSENGETNRWYVDEVNLNKYLNYDYIRVGFQGEESQAGEAILIDGVRVRDIKDYDLETLVKAPSQANTTAPTHFTVTVNNLGNKDADGYSVELHAGKDVVTKDITDPLPMGRTANIDFDYTFPVSATDTVNVWAVAKFDKEEFPADNTSAISPVIVAKPNVPAIADLSAEDNNSYVTLNWTDPATKVKKTEDFENYDAFTTGNPGADSKTRFIGSWTTYDGDQAATTAPTSFTFDGAGSALSYLVMNPSSIDAIASDSKYQAHSGSQYLLAPNSNNGNSDDWLISPSLSGDAQTITFYAKVAPLTAYCSREEFNVLYSTTGSDISDFTKLNTDVVKERNKNDWDEYSYDLPEGTTYFAIESVMRFGMGGLMLDDITYEGGSMPIDHFNIYRDGELIGTAGADATTFTDSKAGRQGHTYNITIVYENGVESAFSNDATTVSTGINSISVDNVKSDGRIYTIDGKEVKNMTRGLYIVNGKKIIKK